MSSRKASGITIEILKGHGPMSSEAQKGITYFHAATTGPSVVIMGGVHGNEPCGADAISKISQALHDGVITLLRGSVTFIIANQQALAQGLRYTERNLNRLFKDNSDESPCYEVTRAEELKPILAASDYLLDIHSASIDAPPFILCEKKELSVVTKLGVEHIVISSGYLGDTLFAGDAEAWARSQGAHAFTLECGQHRDPQAFQVGYEATLRFLSTLEMIQVPFEKAAEEGKVLELYHVEKLHDPAFTYSDTFKCFSPLKAKEVIGVDQFKIHRAQTDSYLVFPANVSDISLGSELYFLAHLV